MSNPAYGFEETDGRECNEADSSKSEDGNDFEDLCRCQTLSRKEVVVEEPLSSSEAGESHEEKLVKCFVVV